jgi:hypothetical protein
VATDSILGGAAGIANIGFLSAFGTKLTLRVASRKLGIHSPQAPHPREAQFAAL